MHPPGSDVVVVRHGEIGVKSDQVRRKMETRLAGNVNSLLADRDVDGEVDRHRNRIFVHTDEPEAATAAATDAFGVVSASPAVTVEPTLEAIADALRDATEAHYDGGTFAVSARRAGEQDAHPFASTDIESEGGSAVWETIESMGSEAEVDLDDPDFELFVECREDEAYVFLEKRDGPGGMPLGTQRPVVAMVSGGIDSPVAAWQMMRRGCPIVPVYVDLGDYGGPDHQARAAATVADLARYAPSYDLDLRIVPGGDVVAELAEQTTDTRMLHLRRFVVAVGEAVARETGAVGVVTGEAIGQKSSQTSANLAVTDAAVELPVHRPCLTMDKTEVIEQARDIGTYEESTIDAGCNRVAPSFPETNADLETVRAVEPDDLFSRARVVAGEAEIVPIDTE
ncbi:thiamine biosynthesis protein ThiI [Halomicrobium zhouii]|uniref:Probable tRNA sulfurtransferase n=1 Tax=Halomicrobium zhouii TaxID=767519 RepID=A0A1I6LVJ9_9EURY|nr:tRNA sulfurtransferase [Halomicrobium zhouii]SFS07465.1 thiamine biosynthesis protein ThiI [Halomicrobium zhouii]